MKTARSHIQPTPSWKWKQVLQICKAPTARTSQTARFFNFPEFSWGGAVQLTEYGPGTSAASRQLQAKFFILPPGVEEAIILAAQGRPLAAQPAHRLGPEKTGRVLTSMEILHETALGVKEINKKC